MNRTYALWVKAGLLGLGLVLLAAVAFAQGGSLYELVAWAVEGGGTTSAGGGEYALSGTAGQPDAGVLAGGPYALSGGFWDGSAMRRALYLPVVMR